MALAGMSVAGILLYFHDQQCTGNPGKDNWKKIEREWGVCIMATLPIGMGKHAAQIYNSISFNYVL